MQIVVSLSVKYSHQKQKSSRVLIGYLLPLAFVFCSRHLIQVQAYFIFQETSPQSIDGTAPQTIQSQGIGQKEGGLESVSRNLTIKLLCMGWED